MRRILSEDKVMANAVHGPGGKSHLPTVAPYTPNYRGVNQVLEEAPGGGEVNFMNALARMSQKDMAEQQELYDNMEVAQTLSDVDMQYRQASDDFLKENQTGQGYTEFATGTYKQLSEEAVSNASSTVQPRLRVIFAARHANIANSAFQKEKEIYTGYAISQTDQLVTRTFNEVADNPDQALSLEVKLEQQLSSMKGILAQQEFEKYRRERIEQFVYFQGMGTIKKNPYQAEQLLHSEYYRSKLPTDKYLSLQNSARQEREHQELVARRYQKLQESALQEEQLRSYDSDFMIPLLTSGEVPSEADIMAKNWSLHLKTKALKTRAEFMQKFDKEQEERSVIDTALENDEFPEGLTQAKQEKYLTNKYKGDGFVQMGEGNAYDTSTMSGKALFLKEYSKSLPFKYEPLIRNITTNLRYGTDETQTMDACVTLAAFHDIPALGGIPADDVAFAMAAAGVYSANQDFPAVQNLQKQYYQASKTEREANKKRFEEDVGTNLESIDGYIQGFYKDYDIDVRGGWFTDASPDLKKVNTLAYDMIKRIYMRTGDRTLSEMTTATYLKSFLKKDKDGVLHINPPSTTNTNFKNATLLSSVSDSALRKAIQNAKEAGFGIESTTRANEIIITNPNLIKDGTRKRRKLYYQCEDPALKRPIYSVYFLADESEPTSRQYLPDPVEGRAIVDFDLLYELMESAKIKRLKTKYNDVADNLYKEVYNADNP